MARGALLQGTKSALLQGQKKTYKSALLQGQKQPTRNSWANISFLDSCLWLHCTPCCLQVAKHLPHTTFQPFLPAFVGFSVVTPFCKALLALLWSQLALLQGLVTASPFAGPASCRESKQLGFFNALLDRVPYVPPPIQAIALPPSLLTSVALEHPIFISTFNQVPPPNPSSSAPRAFHKAPVWVEIVVVSPPKPIVV